MTSWFKVFLWILGGVLVLMFGAGLAGKFLLSESRIDSLLQSINADSLLKISAARGSFSLSDWFMLRPAISLSGVQVSNPEGFSDHSLLEADTVSLQMGLFPLLQNQIHVRNLVFERPHVRVERNAEGVSNVAMLLAGLAAGGEQQPSDTPEGRRWSIDSVSLQSGTVSFTDGTASQPTLNMVGIHLRLTNLGVDEQSEIRLEAHLFGDPASHLRLDGQAGPFRPDSAPAQGGLEVRVVPGNIPISVREKYFGKILRAPGSSGFLRIEADMQGDLAQTFRGDGTLQFNAVRLGKDATNQVPLSGQVPIMLTIQQLIAEPSLELNAPSAALQLGEGQWNGSFSTTYTANRISGEGRGSIQGLHIHDLVSAFTESEGAIFGLGSIPEYTIRFGGRDADQLAVSLTGRGRLELKEGRIAFLDLLDSIQTALERARGGKTEVAGETPFSSLRSNYQVRDRRVILSDIVLENPTLQVTGEGFFTFDQEIQFDLTAHLQGEAAALIRGQQGEAQVESIPVPIQVRGTVAQPRVSPDLERLLRRRGTDFLRSLFR